MSNEIKYSPDYKAMFELASERNEQLKQQLEVFKSPHNINISSSEYAELLALNAELADVTRKNHEFVLYVSELKQQLEEAQKEITLRNEINTSLVAHLEEAIEVIEKVANYTGTTDLGNVISRQFLAKYRGGGEMIPEKYKNTCPLDHSTYEKYIECNCNFGIANEVWYFKEQELAKLTNKFEKAKRYIELCPCDPDIYPDQLKAWNEYQEAIKDD